MPRSPAPSAMKDALLAAVIAKLPSPGTAWPPAEREAWFTLMRQATDVAYGAVEHAIGSRMAEIERLMRDRPSGPEDYRKYWHSISELADPAERIGDIKQPPPRRFYVDHDGFAMCDGRPIDQVDLPATGIMWDERSGIDLGEPTAIMWKTAGTSKTPLPAGIQLRPAEARTVNGGVTT